MKYVLFNIENYINKLRKNKEKSWFDKLILDCSSKIYKLDFKDDDLVFFTSYITRNKFKLCVKFRFYYKNNYCYISVYKDSLKYVITNIYDETKIITKMVIGEKTLIYSNILKDIIKKIKTKIDTSDQINEFNQETIKIKLKKYAKKELILNLKNNYISILFILLSIFLLLLNFNNILNVFLIFFISLFAVIVLSSLFKYLLLLTNIRKDLKEAKIIKIQSNINCLSLASYKYFGGIDMVDEALIFIENDYLKPYCINFFNFIPKEGTKKFKLMLDELESKTYEFIYLKNTKLAIYVDINLLETIYKYKDNVKYSPTYEFLPGLKEVIEIID